MMRAWCERIVESAWFGRVVLAAILLAALLVGLETNRSLMAAYGTIILALDWAVLGFFVLEIVLKMGRHGRQWHRYFLDPWNVFDFCVVAVCFLPLNGHYAAVLRLARILRTLRLITALPKLQLLVGSLLKSVPSMGFVGLLLGVLFYVYAVMGVFLFRDNDPVHFGSLGKAMLSLFQVVTLEGWVDLMFIQMRGSDAMGLTLPAGVQAVPQARPLLAVLYFVSFVFLGTMIMLNLFVGVIVNSMDEARMEREREEQARHRAELGGLTLADEITMLEHQLDALQTQLRMIKHRAQRDA